MAAKYKDGSDAKPTTLVTSTDRRQFIKELKARVISSRVSAARAITREAILLYWDIGCAIVEKQKGHDWGDSVVGIGGGDRCCGLAAGVSGSEKFLIAKHLADAAALSHS